MLATGSPAVNSSGDRAGCTETISSICVRAAQPSPAHSRRSSMFSSKPEVVALLWETQVTKHHSREMEAKPGGGCGHRGTNCARMMLGSCILLVLSSWSGRKVLCRVLLSAHVSLQHQTMEFKLSISALLGCKGLNCSSYAN